MIRQKVIKTIEIVIRSQPKHSLMLRFTLFNLGSKYTSYMY